MTRFEDELLHRSEEFETGQVGLKYVTWAYSNVYLSQTMWNRTFAKYTSENFEMQ